GGSAGYARNKSPSLAPKRRYCSKPQTGIRVRTIHGSPPQTPGTLSMPGKASPKSCTTHWSSCAFSARLMAARSFSALCRRVMTGSLSCRLLVRAPQYSLFRIAKRIPVKVRLCCPCPLRQFVKQRPSLLQVGGVKALGEPAIERREQVVGRSALPLPLPQARQAHGGPQLQRFRFLVAGNV